MDAKPLGAIVECVLFELLPFGNANLSYCIKGHFKLEVGGKGESKEILGTPGNGLIFIGIHTKLCGNSPPK